LAWAPEKFEMIAQLTTEILNISYAKSIIEPQEFLLAYYNCSLRGPAGNCSKNAIFCP
jgi:hypothetical protein